jgi:adenosylmethionine-8-amino-7-oxononanoate aminotransferase
MAAAADFGDHLAFDRRHLWHPYGTVIDPPPVFPVVSAAGVRLTLADGRTLIDGMASWWSAIHGYNHPALNAAIEGQLRDMAHVMFGGLTHRPAIELARRLIEMTPAPLEVVFFADSGSVSVEVAIKMAVQYQAARGRSHKHRLLTIRRGYHGDTLGAMSVCDPVTGMHALFAGILPQQLFADAPAVRFGAPWREEDTASLRQLMEAHHEDIAALILEPVVQGAGGMWFYHPEYLRRARALCDEFDVLLILDEIATGFGRSGRLFGCEHAGVAPDIMCLGKALTGGYVTLAATLATRAVADTVSRAGGLMHGPTFMANPLACAVAIASLELLGSGAWEQQVSAIEAGLRAGLAPCRGTRGVRDVRVLGAIGVVELEQPVDMHRAPAMFVERGVWVRPFARLIYVMPPYVINESDLRTLTAAVCEVVAEIEK